MKTIHSIFSARIPLYSSVAISSMGNRLHLGTGYGILLSVDELLDFDAEATEGRADAYFEDRIERSYKWANTKPLRVPDDPDEEERLVYYSRFVDARRSKERGELVIKGGDVESARGEVFLCPGDGRSLTFLGFINDVHVDEDTSCACLWPLEQLGVISGHGEESFEYLVPANGKDPATLDTGSAPPFIPNLNIIGMDAAREFADLAKAASIAGKPLPFQTREESDAFALAALKDLGITSVYRRTGLEFVRIFYPGKTAADVERYIVGWWC